MSNLTRGERLQIMLTKEEVEALDNWRFNKRMPSRAAAIRELLKRGLAAEGFWRHRPVHRLGHRRQRQVQQVAGCLFPLFPIKRALFRAARPDMPWQFRM